MASRRSIAVLATSAAGAGIATSPHILQLQAAETSPGSSVVPCTDAVVGKVGSGPQKRPNWLGVCSVERPHTRIPIAEAIRSRTRLEEVGPVSVPIAGTEGTKGAPSLLPPTCQGPQTKLGPSSWQPWGGACRARTKRTSWKMHAIDAFRTCRLVRRRTHATTNTTSHIHAIAPLDMTKRVQQH